MTDVIGTPVRWYRINGWIPQAGGPNWTRYIFCLLGLPIVRTPWFYVGALDA